MPNKKEPLSLIIVKTLLVVLIFTAVGTIIIGGGYIIKEYYKTSNNQSSNNKIWNVIHKCSEKHPEFCDRSCRVDSDCYPTCSYNMGCLKSGETQVGANAIRCEIAPFSCKCENNKCEIVEYDEIGKGISITTDKTEYEQGGEIKITLENNSKESIFSIASSLTPEASINGIYKQRLDKTWDYFPVRCDWPECDFDFDIPSELKVGQSAVFNWKPNMHINDRDVSAGQGLYYFGIGYQLERNRKWLEIYSNKFTIKEEANCAKEGEPINPPYLKGKTNHPDICCEGLIGVGGYEISRNGECEILVGNPYLWCVPCGNGICDKFKTIEENKCNCPEDCGEENGEKIALCEEIIYEDSKNNCYLDYAMSRNNKNLCEKITDNALKNQCYNILSEKDKKDIPVLLALGSEPDAMPIAKTTNVLFTTMQTGIESKADKIIVEEIDNLGKVLKIIGDLNDDGIDGDLTANDYVYSGTFKISSSAEGYLFFRAKAIFSDISTPIYTENYKLGVTRFPIGVYSSDMSKVVTDSKTGEEIISNEVIVGFIDSASPDTIENIVEAVNGEVVGTIFGIGSYQIKIFDTGDATGVNKTIDKLLNYPEVKYAEPNYITEID